MRRPDESELLAFGAEIAAYERPSAPPALRARLRGSLLGARTGPSGEPALGWLRAGALRPVLAALAALAIVAAAGGAAAAVSLPGDPTFALKRAADRVEIALAPDEASRLDLLVAQADRRLRDLAATSEKRPGSATPAADEYKAAVDRVEAALTILLTRPAGSARDAAIAGAAAASADHIAALESLAGRLPASAQPGIERAIEVQQGVQGKSGDAPGRPGDPGGRPSDVPGGPPPGRGAPPVKGPGRP